MNGETIIIGFIIGLIAYSCLNVGRVFQKMGIELLKKKKNVKNTAVWGLGTALTTTFLFVQWLGLIFAPINVIAPLEAYGLVLLMILSFIVLNESLTNLNGIGIILIIIGTVFSTLFNLTGESVDLLQFNLAVYIILAMILLGVECVLAFLAKLKFETLVGIILSIISGTLMAFQTVAKRVTATPNAELQLYFTIITLALATATLIVVNFAYAKTTANIAVPSFTAASIVFSILVGVLVQIEIVNFVQVIGLILIIIGITLMMMTKESDKELSEKI